MPEDSLLIRRLQNGDNLALSMLYDRYSGALLGVILRMCKDRAKAEDLLQETFIKIWNQSHTYSLEKGKFYTWAYRIAKNTTLNELRKSSNLIQEADLSVYKEESKEENVEINIQALRGRITRLEPHHREAIELVYFRGYTHNEAHEHMDVPLGTFKSYVQQALKKLRESYSAIYLMIGLLLERML